MKKILLLLLIIVWTLLITSILHSQWVRVESGTTEQLTDVVMLDSSTAIAVGRGRSILRTSDGGKTWENLTIMLSSVMPWNGVSFLDTTYGITVGESQIRLTSDGGRMWWYGSLSQRRSFLCALYLASGNIYVGADSGWIYHSLDTGKTWTSEKISEEPIRSMFAWTGEYVMGLPIYALTSTTLYENRTFPEGDWQVSQVISLGLGSEVFDGEFVKGGGSGFISGVQGDLWEEPVVYRKKLADTLWRNSVITIFTPGTMRRISAASSEVIFACGTQGMILYSPDGGDNWSISQSGVRANLNAINFFDENHGLAVGDSGVILRYNKRITDVKNDNINPSGFILYQNYPNPFNPKTKIKFSIPSSPFNKGGEGDSSPFTKEPVPPEREGQGDSKQWVTLKVYDTLGNEVATLVNERKPAGEYEVEFDGSNLSSGVYLYQIKAGNETLSNKLMLLK